MWFFILFTQLLAIMTSAILYWLVKPKLALHKKLLIAIVFAINNIALIYGLSEFWYERFHVYLVISILQGFLLYGVLIAIASGIIYRLLLKRRLAFNLVRLLTFISFIAIVSLAVFNAYSPVVRHLTVTTDKPMAQPMDIALVSDTHLGRWFGNRQIDKMVGLIAEQNADVIVIAGDIMNDTTIAYDKTNMHERLSKLQAPLGVYATLGNHDYLGFEERITAAVEQAGIKALDNQSVLLDDSVWLVGRSDDVDLTRLSAVELLKTVETDKPVIFLEHRPSALEEISALPIDLHLAGHTHGGQIFPLTLLLHWFTPLSYGTETIEDTQFLVTSGYGIGPVPFRLGTRSEIWMVRLQAAS